MYAVTYYDLPARERDSANCAECKEEMLAWNDTASRAFARKRRGDGSEVVGEDVPDNKPQKKQRNKSKKQREVNARK